VESGPGLGESGLEARIQGELGPGVEGSDLGTVWQCLCRAVARYHGRFHTKLSCFSDLRPYLAVFLLEAS
ncbi:unnamed protein product, partial [Discosporangium mesarthrocarpum]